MKDFDIKKWSENNELLARECFEDFLRDHKDDIEEIKDDRKIMKFFDNIASKSVHESTKQM